MLRRLWCALHDGYVTRRLVFNITRSISSQHADVNVAKRETDDVTHGNVSTVDDTPSWKAVVKRPNRLTREPFVKNLFLGKFDTVSCTSPYGLFFLDFIIIFCSDIS